MVKAQRVKLSKELSRRDTGRTPCNILDEPTTGLHFHDIEALLGVLPPSCATKANTVVVIEHNLDVIKTADWIVDLARKAATAVAPSWSPARRKTWRPVRSRIPASSWRACCRPPARARNSRCRGHKPDARPPRKVKNA